MSTKLEEMKAQEAIDENACVVCFKPTQIYSIGSCNHAVCFECSSRMRCLCLQNECPICRQDLPKVIFTKSVAPFATLDRELRSGLYEKKYRIAFADLDIQKCFYNLLQQRCPVRDCNQTSFIEFNKLKEHVRKTHEKFYCEICTDNLNIFISERRVYTRSQLATHRRVGDPDDKSHKGHPRCEYCELRFLDKDELFRHLRREHYFCHLCDADGINLFYGAINEMRDHFKTEHFICEEEDCIDEQFTAVFRTEIDLRAHIATEHCKSMSRTAAKQARTIDLDFSYGPRGRGGGGQENSRNHRIRTNDTQREFDRIPEPTIVQQAPIQIDAKNEEQFPSLGGPSAGHSVQLANTVRHVSYGTAGLLRTKENYPALGGMPVNDKSAKYQVQQPVKTGKQYKTPSASSMLKGPAAKQSTVKNVQRQTSAGSKVMNAASDFPALAQSTKKNPNKNEFFEDPFLPPPTYSRKPATTSTRPSSSITNKPKPAADFPSLSQSAAKKSRSKNELLLEDMILPTAVNKNLVSSKHRGLVEDNYVSMASTVSKMQTVQQKDIQPVPIETVKKNVPKLNSADNFPSLGGGFGGESNAAQWMTVQGRPANEPPRKGKKVHDMPEIAKVHEKPQNGMVNLKKRVNEVKKSENGMIREKTKSENNNKENKDQYFLTEKSFGSADAAPPPGFIKSVPPANKPPPGFSMSDENDSDDYSYSAPTNATKRNQALVSEFQKTLTTAEAMQQFRQTSQMFRDGNYFAKSYYETCKIVLGAGFDTVFPELLALLPDIEKQQSLYAVYSAELRQNESSGAKPKKKNLSQVLEICATCNQVLVTSDLATHLQSHALANNFPLLSLSGASTVTQWKK